MKEVDTADSEFVFYGQPQHETRPRTDPERLRVTDVTLPPERALYRFPHYPNAHPTTALTIEPLLDEEEEVRILE